MEIEQLFGLPAHPLLVHAPVVLIPLAGIIAIVFAFRTAWLDRFGWGLVALTGLGALGGILAAGSGEALEEAQERAGESASQLAEDHFELGEVARTVGLVFFVVVLAVVAVRWYARRKGETEGIWATLRSKGAAVVMSLLLVASAAAATSTISAAGHQGAKLVWETDAG